MDREHILSRQHIKWSRKFVGKIAAEIENTGNIHLSNSHFIRSIRILSDPENEWLADIVKFKKILKVVEKILKTTCKKSRSTIRMVKFDCCFNTWRVEYKNGIQTLYAPEWRTGIDDTSIDCEMESRMNSEMFLSFN